MRSTRKQPFCWQEKKINRLIRKIYSEDSGKKSKMLLLYQTLTEIDSDFNGKEISFFTKTISTYSGLSVRFIPKALEEFQELKILKIIEKKDGGKFAGKDLIFTPDEVIDSSDIKKPDNKAKLTVSQEPTTGVRPTDSQLQASGENAHGNIAHVDTTNAPITNDASANGNSTAGQNTPLEDSFYLEDNINKNNNKEEEKEVMLLLEWYGFNFSLIIKFIGKYSLDRIREVIAAYENNPNAQNPAGFIRKALEDNYVFNQKEKEAEEKKKVFEEKQKQVAQKESAKKQLDMFIKNQVNTWIETNNDSYQDMLQAENKKIAEKSPTMKNVEILARSIVRACIKEKVLGL